MAIQNKQKDTKIERAERYRQILNPRKQDLSEAVNTKKTYYIDNQYDILRVIAKVNKDNKIKLTMHEISYNYLSDNEISITAKGTSKNFCGKVNIKIDKDSHKRYIFSISIIASLIMIAIGLFIFLGIYFLVGKDNNQIGIALLSTGGALFIACFISIICLIIKWPTKLSKKQKEALLK